MHALIAWDGTDADAPARRAAARPRHLDVITRWAASGRLLLAVPLFRERDGRALGSLMVLDEDEVGLKEYLAEEPFARDGVWLSFEARPFRLASLPWQPLPCPGPPSTSTCDPSSWPACSAPWP